MSSVEPTPPAEPPPAQEVTADTPASTGTVSAPAPEPRSVLHTRTGASFMSLMAGAVILVLLLVFILENTGRIKITYFGATGHLPLGVALLLAAVAGALIVGIVGSARILQLRRSARRTRKRVRPSDR